MPEPDAKAIIKRTEALKGKRTVYDNHVEEVRELMNPGGDEFIGDSTLGAWVLKFLQSPRRKQVRSTWPVRRAADTKGTH